MTGVQTCALPIYEPNMSMGDKFEKAKKIIFSTSNDVFQIYKLDFDFSNIVWNDYLAQQNLMIANKKLELNLSKILASCNKNILHITKGLYISSFA